MKLLALQLQQTLDGKKTYLAMGVAAFYSVAHFVAGDTTLAQCATEVLHDFGIAALRMGVAKAGLK